jgi:hypothetical protein
VKLKGDSAHAPAACLVSRVPNGESKKERIKEGTNERTNEHIPTKEGMNEHPQTSFHIYELPVAFSISDAALAVLPYMYT